MFYVLAKHLGPAAQAPFPALAPKQKGEFYAPHDNLAAAAASAGVLHLLLCTFLLSFLRGFLAFLSLLSFFFGQSESE